MSFIDQKPHIATEKEVGHWGGSREKGKRFRCYLCGHKFEVGDSWRWVYGKEISNFLVCESCDSDYVEEDWIKANKELRIRFWWIIQDYEDAWFNTNTWEE